MKKKSVAIDKLPPKSIKAFKVAKINGAVDLIVLILGRERSVSDVALNKEALEREIEKKINAGFSVNSKTEKLKVLNGVLEKLADTLSKAKAERQRLYNISYNNLGRNAEYRTACDYVTRIELDILVARKVHDSINGKKTNWPSLNF